MSTQLIRNRQSELMFDSADPKNDKPFIVHVEARSVVVLEIGGAEPGVVATVEHSVGNPTHGVWQRLAIAGIAAELSVGNTKLLLDVPGTYRVSVDTAASPRVVMSAERRAQGEVWRMEVTGAAPPPAPPAPPLIITGGLPAAVPPGASRVMVDADTTGGGINVTGWAPVGIADSTVVQIRKTDTSANSISFTDSAGVAYSFVNTRGEFITLMWIAALGSFRVV